jgi:hypothetical protein
VDPEHLSDDVALLVVRQDGLPEQSRPAHDRTSFERVDPRAARAARDFIARFSDRVRVEVSDETSRARSSKVPTCCPSPVAGCR